MNEYNNMATENTINRQFLDYEGLSTFWKGIKDKFVGIDSFESLSSTVDGFADSLEAQRELLNTINTYVEKLSPLQAKDENELQSKGNSALLGSIIYLKQTNDSTNWPVGPYMVIAAGNLKYINLTTVEGEVDTEQIVSMIEGLSQTITAYGDRLDNLENSLENRPAGISYEIVDNLPSSGSIKAGTMYFVKDSNTDTYTEYMGINISGNTNALEKIGVGIDDVKTYVNGLLEPINTQINTLSSSIANINDNFENRSKTIILNELTNGSNESIGGQIRITDTQINNLLKS